MENKRTHSEFIYLTSKWIYNKIRLHNSYEIFLKVHGETEFSYSCWHIFKLFPNVLFSWMHVWTKHNFTVTQIGVDVSLHTDNDTYLAYIVYLCHSKNNCQLSNCRQVSETNSCVQISQHTIPPTIWIEYKHSKRTKRKYSEVNGK